MWKLKGCPKCKGDLFFDRDMDGRYGQCLQCGYRCDIRKVDLESWLGVEEQGAQQKEKEPVPAGGRGRKSH